MEYVLPPHVVKFLKDKDLQDKQLELLKMENEILRRNVRDCEIQIRDARIRIKDLTS